MRNAGFEVVGVDYAPQPRYPYEFHPGDAFDALDSMREGRLGRIDAIHASPPCQAYSPHLRHRSKPTEMLIPRVRALLEETALPYVIENVKGAPLTGMMLCGSSFGLPLWRHRYFETNPYMLGPPCRHDEVPAPLNPVQHREQAPRRGSPASPTHGSRPRCKSTG